MGLGDDGADDTTALFGDVSAPPPADPPAGDPPPADPPAGDPPAGDPPAEPEWVAALSVEGDGTHPANRDFAKAKGWKTPDDAVRSYREAERALRESGRVKIPTDASSAEERAAFNKAIGVPDNAAGYVFTPPNDADGKPVELDAALLERIATTAHKQGIPKAALEAVVAEYVQGQIEDLAAVEKTLKENADGWVKKQGQQADDKVAAVKAAVREFGLTRSEQLSLRAAWGAERSLDIMAKIGEGLAEGTLIDGGARRFSSVSGEAAQARLNTKLADKEWADKARVPGTPENAEYHRLNDAIGADADRKAAQQQ
jgi:hypothetical protein